MLLHSRDLHGIPARRASRTGMERREFRCECYLGLPHEHLQQEKRRHLHRNTENRAKRPQLKGSGRGNGLSAEVAGIVGEAERTGWRSLDGHRPHIHKMERRLSLQTVSRALLSQFLRSHRYALCIMSLNAAFERFTACECGRGCQDRPELLRPFNSRDDFADISAYIPVSAGTSNERNSGCVTYRK